MKKVLFFLSAIILVAISAQTVTAQGTLQDEEYSHVTMDLRGILDLTMTTDPQVDFSFKTIQDYQIGIQKYNAVRLDVDATVTWDLFVYAADTWDQIDVYSANGAATLPAEILMLSSNYDNSAIVTGVGIGSTLQSLRGITNAGVVAGVPAAATQFLRGDLDLAVFGTPGTAAANPDGNQFRINYALFPGIPATFNAHNETYAGNPLDLTAVDAGNLQDYAQAGFYYIEVVYNLVENL